MLEKRAVSPERRKSIFFHFQEKKSTSFSFSMGKFFHVTLMLIYETPKIGPAYLKR